LLKIHDRSLNRPSGNKPATSMFGCYERKMAKSVSSASVQQNGASIRLVDLELKLI